MSAYKSVLCLYVCVGGVGVVFFLSTTKKLTKEQTKAM